MFGWFRPICPCDAEAKKWIEDSFQWLARQFGLHILLEKNIILPTAEFFPDPWDGSDKAVRQLFDRLCSYMDIDRDDVKMKLIHDRAGLGLAALDPSRGAAAATWSKGEESYSKGIIRIERAAIGHRDDLIGIIAHELSHQRLLGEGRYRCDKFDNELLTDLTAIYFGFGVFLANNRNKSTGELGRWPGTKLFRPEYLSEPMMGYALAHLAWFRDEHRPPWSKHLRSVPYAVFKQGLNYLEKTGDSTFKPIRMR